MSSNTAPTAYQPAYSPQADASLQAGATQLQNAGSTLYGQVTPQLSQITSNVTNNPYYAQALAGAQATANTATNTVAPAQLAMGSQLQGAAGTATATGAADSANAAAVGSHALAQTQALQPLATSGAQYAAPVFNQAQSYIPVTSNPELYAGQQVLNNAFDPQSALYNQQYRQTIDQQNAINAMSGIAGSPYGAGITGNAAQNFNLNWQNAQLNRQIAGLGAYDSAATTAAQNVEGLQSTGVNDYNALVNSAINNATNLINTGTGAYYGGISTGANALAELTNAATGADTAASNIDTAALNTEAGAAQLPSDVYLAQQQANLAALGSQITGTNASLSAVQQAIADQNAYLNTGISAANQATNAAQVNNQANAGFGNLFGSALGMFAFV